ncbi:hypothetical protein PanWU01x14_036900 [Parasponia andersonii]|uniref:Uncharacterized protein n=1 Tax=Parasponia andersonii TaxID=3476 RepID=A0A2P5DSM4_PARAD|nr:hypothetical protein PanWU01x14_036900 [Parasponia andersonii]
MKKILFKASELDSQNTNLPSNHPLTGDTTSACRPSLRLIMPPSTGIYAWSCSTSRLILVFTPPPNTEHHPTKQAQAFLVQCRPILATGFQRISFNCWRVAAALGPRWDERISTADQLLKQGVGSVKKWPDIPTKLTNHKDSLRSWFSLGHF